jgi:hypothetical protein
MNTMERLFISGFGALIPILAILYTKGIVAETDGIAMKAAIAVAIGCFFGYLRKDETDRWVLLQVGLAVPALLTSMVANSTANQQKNEKEALQQILKPSSAPVPSVPGSTGPAARLLWQDLLTLPSVHAQNDDKKVYVPSQPNVLQVLGITPRSDWYVLAACHLSSNSAAEHATAARSAHPKATTITASPSARISASKTPKPSPPTPPRLSPTPTPGKSASPCAPRKPPAPPSRSNSASPPTSPPPSAKPPSSTPATSAADPPHSSSPPSSPHPQHAPSPTPSKTPTSSTPPKTCPAN